MQTQPSSPINFTELAELLRELAVDASDLAEHYAKESTEHHNNLKARHAAASSLRSKRAYRAAEAIEAAIGRTG